MQLYLVVSEDSNQSGIKNWTIFGLDSRKKGLAYGCPTVLGITYK